MIENIYAIILTPSGCGIIVEIERNVNAVNEKNFTE